KGNDSDRNRIVDALGDLDVQLCRQYHLAKKCLANDDASQQYLSQFNHQFNRSSGLKVNNSVLKSRLNSCGSMPCNSRMVPTLLTAVTAARSNALSPLDCPPSTSITSPVGTRRMRNTAIMPFRALGGRDHCC